jgi:hypothetical protein
VLSFQRPACFSFLTRWPTRQTIGTSKKMNMPGTTEVTFSFIGSVSSQVRQQPLQYSATLQKPRNIKSSFITRDVTLFGAHVTGTCKKKGNVRGALPRRLRVSDD